VPVVPESELTTWPTRRLLARLERLRYCEESLARSDMTETEVARVDGILFKESEIWRDAYDTVKRVLATRDHVLR